MMFELVSYFYFTLDIKKGQVIMKERPVVAVDVRVGLIALFPSLIF